jgi:four helix bundle protein
MGDYKKLLAFEKGFSLAMEINELIKSFPKEEKYNLSDQMRRSSRSVCVNVAEAYRRRRFKAYFISKLNDAETENTETQVWLDFALACGYISKNMYDSLSTRNDEIGKLIWYMINHPEKFL